MHGGYPCDDGCGIYVMMGTDVISDAYMPTMFPPVSWTTPYSSLL